MVSWVYGYFESDVYDIYIFSSPFDLSILYFKGKMSFSFLIRPAIIADVVNSIFKYVATHASNP